MSEKTESKQAQIIAFLKSEASEGKSNTQVAAMFGCNEGTVRRSRRIVEAEAQADRMIARGVDSGEVVAILKAVLAAGSYGDELDLTEEELREELKEIKALREDAARKEKAVRKQAEERLPLFDRPAATQQGGDGHRVEKPSLYKMVAQSA